MRWAESASSGKPMPLNRDQERGNVLIDAHSIAHAFRDNAAARAAQISSPDRFRPVFFISHHATCPRGRDWRGKRRSDADAPPAQGSLL